MIGTILLVLLLLYFFFTYLRAPSSNEDTPEIPRKKEEVDLSQSGISLTKKEVCVSDLLSGRIKLVDQGGNPYKLKGDEQVIVRVVSNGSAPITVDTQEVSEGIFEFSYLPTREGTLTILVYFLYMGREIKCKDITIPVKPGPIDPKQLQISDFSNLPQCVGTPREFVLITRDTHGNRRMSGGDVEHFSFKLWESDEVIENFVIVDNQDGTYTVHYCFETPVLFFFMIFFKNEPCLMNPLCICALSPADFKQVNEAKLSNRYTSPITKLNDENRTSCYIKITQSQISIQQYRKFIIEFFPDTVFSCRISTLLMKATPNHLILREGRREVKISDDNRILLAAIILYLRFENKETYDDRIQSLGKLLRERLPPSSYYTKLVVNRESLLASSLKYMNSNWRTRFQFTFEGENGIDVGGLYKEFFEILLREIFNCESDAESKTFHLERGFVIFNPSGTSEKDRIIAKLAGLVLGKMIYDQCAHELRTVVRIPQIPLSPIIYKLILQLPIQGEDLMHSEEYASRYEYIMKNDIDSEEVRDVLDLTFSVEKIYKVKNGGFKSEIIPLKSKGDKIPVTNETKAEYLDLLAGYYFYTQNQTLITAFLKGFYSIVPHDCISHLDTDDLEILLCGSQDIDIYDFQNNVRYSGWNANSREVKWFWECLSTFTDVQRRKLLGFITGSTTLPYGGFAGLYPPITILRSYLHDRLPITHTCFNQIELPTYSSYQKLRHALITAITYGSEGFAIS